MATFLKSLVLFLLVAVQFGCKQDKIDPSVGDLRIKVAGSTGKYLDYELYTEASYAAAQQSIYNLPLKKGVAYGTIEIKGVNPGNYIIYINSEGLPTVTQMVQVTAKKVKEYSF
jgi:hypothetical protein